MSVTKVQLVGNVFGDASFSGSVGIGTTDPTSTLTVIGEIETTNLVANGNVEFGSGVTIIGVTTSSDGFDGDLTGNADTATAVRNFRDFSISGDATASSVSFNGTANVGLALTLADTAVSPGSYGSSTEVATFTVDSKGRLTAAGTAAVGTALTVTGDSGLLDINLLSETLTIAGGDNLTSIGFGNTITVNLNDDISLVNILSVGVITAVSGFVGNISGDLTGNVNAFAFDTNNDGVVVTGIATATSFSGDNLIIVNGTITNLTGTAGTITTLDTTNLTGTAGTITTFNSIDGTITNLTGTAGTITTFNSTNGTITNITGTAGTITTLDTTNLTGTAGTITTFNSTNGTITNITGTAGTITTFNSTNGTITNLTGTAGTITTFNSTNGTITNLTGTAGTITTFNSIDGTITNLTGTAGTITTFNSTNGTITNLTGTAGTITTLDTTNLTGTAGTITTFNSTNGTITNLTSTNTNTSGISTVGSLNIGSTQVISSARELQNIVSLDATTTATIESAIASGPNTFTDLTVTGISTFTNGPVMVGSGVSTGTSEQRLQVTGGAYVSGSVGIGTTNPVFKAEIAGDARITSSNKLRFGGTSGTTNFYIQYNSTTNSLDFVAG
jgi:trimeric autotransporter adhesin